MKTLNTTIAFILMLFLSSLMYAQSCIPAGTVTQTGNPGEVQIIDNSTTSSGSVPMYSWVKFYNSLTGDFEGVVNLRPNSVTGTFQFTDNGTYDYYIVVQDSLANCLDSVGGSIIINTITTNCDASFTFINTVNNVVDFSPDNYDSNLEYHWDFGNGLSNMSPNASHTYYSPGVYTVCLTVWDDSGNSNCLDSTCQIVEIDSNQCTASADFSYTDLGNGTYEFQINNVTNNTVYSWNIGSGNYYGPNATHTFSSNSLFYASVIATDTTIPTCRDTSNQAINVDTCNYDGSFSYIDTINGQIAFSPVSYDSNLDYHWDFGDGNYSNDPYPFHAYTSPGTYTACLTEWNSSGSSYCADTVCQTIVVDSNSCNVSASYTYTTSGNGTYHFQITNVTSNTVYDWNIGAGNYTGPNVTHTFPSNNPYFVVVHAIDTLNQSCVDTVICAVNVTNVDTCDLDASFTSMDTTNNQTAFFPDHYDSNVAYHWDFGDGNWSTDPYPTHIYANPGTYSACLIVWTPNNGNCADTVCETIIIDSINCNASANYTYTSLGNGTYDFQITNVTNNTVYDWNIDGNSYTGSNVTHTFPSNGMFYVIVYATNTLDQSCIDTVTCAVNVTNIDTCDLDASFTYFDTTNNQIAFSPSNYDPNSSFYWDFGDGNTSTDLYPTHTYANPGTYTACFMVSTNSSTGYCADTVCQTIFVDSNNCNVSAVYTYTSLGNGTYDFQITNITSNTVYDWSIGAGNYSGSNVTHTFPSNGSFNVTVLATDTTNLSCMDTLICTMNVTTVDTCDLDASFTSMDTTYNQTVFSPDNYNSNVHYHWDFGDGNWSTDPYPIHTYANPGTYNACLTVWGPNNGGCVDTLCETIIVDSNNCNVSAVYTYTSVGNGTYDFQITNVISNTVYDWYIGGSNYNGANVTHTFPSNGSFNVSVFATDTTNLSCIDTAICTINVTNVDTCDFDASFGYIDSTNGQISFFPDNYDPTGSYDWNFGDGTHSSDAYPTHTYANSGNYTVCLTIWESGSNGFCADTVCQTVVIDTDTCDFDASFSYIDSTNGQISFSPDNYDPTGLYDWNFGDGNHSSNAYPTHTYANSGNYTVCLTIWESGSNGFCADTVCQTVVINNNPSQCNANFTHYDSLNESFFLPNTNTSNLSYYWEFGDGSYSYDMNGQHTYSSPGTYNVCLNVWNSATNCSDTICQDITIGQTAGVGRNTLDETSVKLYPNPASYEINLSVKSNEQKEVNYTLLDVTGKIVMNGSVNVAEGINDEKINIQSLRQGVYFIKLDFATNQEHLKTLKFIKK